jgi:hypothetical protein
LQPQKTLNLTSLGLNQKQTTEISKLDEDTTPVFSNFNEKEARERLISFGKKNLEDEVEFKPSYKKSALKPSSQGS